MTDLFTLHPFVSLIYFLSVFAVVMFSQNPVLVIIALICGMSFLLKSKKDIEYKEFIWYAVLFLTVSLTNPLFSHAGQTVLIFINDNPVTLEALFYGVYLAVMIVCVVVWFKAFNRVINDEKWIYLTAKISPKLSLLISLILRYIPRLKERSIKIRNAQKALGMFSSDGITDKLKSSVNVYSAVITYALENAMDTSNSMKARGYGLKGRTNYSQFKFKKNDLIFLIIVFVLDFSMIALSFKSKVDFKFYPIVAFEVNNLNKAVILLFAILCLLPLILSIREDIKWHCLKSKI